MREIQVRTGRQVADVLAGEYVSVFKGRGMEFDEVRPYIPGDDIRTIDWNVTARVGAPYVKRFVEERELTIMLMVDLSASLRFGSVAQTKREVAAELAALLAFSAVKNNDRVGLILFTDRVEKFVVPKKGRKHVLRLITEILTFRPEHSGTQISDALGYLSRVVRRKAITFLMSDFQVPVGSFDHSLRIVARRHDLVPVVVRDAMEEELPSMGLVLMEDLETGAPIWVDTASRRVRQRYQTESRIAHNKLLEEFRKAKLDAINVETGGEYVAALMKFFRLRARRF